MLDIFSDPADEFGDAGSGDPHDVQTHVVGFFLETKTEIEDRYDWVRRRWW